MSNTAAFQKGGEDAVPEGAVLKYFGKKEAFDSSSSPKLHVQ